MHYKLSQFNIVSSRSNALTDIFVAQPDSIKEALAGKIFILAEIKEKNNEAEKIKNFLFNNAYHTYYNNEKILLREKVSSLKVEHLFESVIAKINKNFAEFIKNEKIIFDYSRLNITIGVIFENQLHFSGIGRNKIFFIHRRVGADQELSIQNEFVVSDISGSFNRKDEDPSSSFTLFRELLSGELPDKSLFFFSNEALPEYISQAQLKQILVNLPPSGAAEQIKNTLSSVNSFISFSGLIIKRIAFEKDESINTVQRIGTNNSILNLNNTEDTTSSLLAPSGLVSPKRWLSLFKMFGASHEIKAKIFLKDKIFMKRKSLPILKIFDFLRDVLLYALNLILLFLVNVKKLPSLIGVIRSVELKNILIVSWSKIKSTQLITKLLMIALVLVSSIFVYNIKQKKVSNLKIETDKKYTEVSQQIEKKQLENEFNVMIKDDAKIRTTLGEISKLLAELPQETEVQKASYAQIKKQYEEQLVTLDKVTVVKGAKELVDFSRLGNNNPESILRVEDSGDFFAFDGQSGTISLFESADKMTSIISTSSQSLKFVAQQKNRLAVFGGMKAFSISLTDNELRIIMDDQDKEVVSVKSYNDNLYLLSSRDNQIYKYNSNDSRLQNAQGWFKETVDLAGAVDMSLTGDIFVLKNTGEVAKFTLGKKKDFKLSDINPPFISAQKIFVSPDKDFIYILEPDNKRLAVFTKTDGKYLMQYSFEEMTNIKDFAIDEKNKKIYVLNNASLFETVY